MLLVFAKEHTKRKDVTSRYDTIEKGFRVLRRMLSVEISEVEFRQRTFLQNYSEDLRKKIQNYAWASSLQRFLREPD